MSPHAVPVNVSGSYPVSGMITVPLPVYQTVVANIQGQDGQPLQVVTPLVQVPKLEPGLEGSVEVSAGLNASLDASTIISSGQAQVPVGLGAQVQGSVCSAPCLVTSLFRNLVFLFQDLVSVDLCICVS